MKKALHFIGEFVGGILSTACNLILWLLFSIIILGIFFPILLFLSCVKCDFSHINEFVALYVEGSLDILSISNKEEAND